MSSRTIIVGLDGSPGSDAAGRWCIDVAGLLDAEIIAVYALPPMIEVVPAAGAGTIGFFDENLRGELEQSLHTWCAPIRAAGVPCREELLDGSPAEVLIRVAEDVHAVMIVVGRRGHGVFAELLLGSVPHRLTHHAPCPVVVVPAVQGSAS